MSTNRPSAQDLPRECILALLSVEITLANLQVGWVRSSSGEEEKNAWLAEQIILPFDFPSKAAIGEGFSRSGCGFLCPVLL